MKIDKIGKAIGLDINEMMFESRYAEWWDKPCWGEKYHRSISYFQYIKNTKVLHSIQLILFLACASSFFVIPTKAIVFNLIVCPILWMIVGLLDYYNYDMIKDD